MSTVAPLIIELSLRLLLYLFRMRWMFIARSCDITSYEYEYVYDWSVFSTIHWIMQGCHNSVYSIASEQRYCQISCFGRAQRQFSSGVEVEDVLHKILKNRWWLRAGGMWKKPKLWRTTQLKNVIDCTIPGILKCVQKEHCTYMFHVIMRVETLRALFSSNFTDSK